MSLEDKIDQAKGTLKEGLGKVTGDKGLETEGVVEGVVSKAKEVAHDVAEAAKGAVEGIKNSLGK